MRILMATGGGPQSAVALRFCGHLAERTGEPVTVLTVVKRAPDRAAAELLLERAAAILGENAVAVRTRLRVGHPAEEILREIEEGAYHLLVVGEKQHLGLATRFGLGSTAVRLVEHAPCPVVIAKGRTQPLGSILLCDSGVRNPSLLDRFAEQLAALLRCEDTVTVLHVMSQMAAGPQVEEAALHAGAEELIARHAPEGDLLERDLELVACMRAGARAKVRHGLVVDEILAEAVDGDYSLVVIGAFRGGGWRRILLDDLAHQVILRADRPVLVVR